MVYGNRSPAPPVSILLPHSTKRMSSIGDTNIVGNNITCSPCISLYRTSERPLGKREGGSKNTGIEEEVTHHGIKDTSLITVTVKPVNHQESRCIRGQVRLLRISISPVQRKTSSICRCRSLITDNGGGRDIVTKCPSVRLAPYCYLGRRYISLPRMQCINRESVVSRRCEPMLV